MPTINLITTLVLQPIILQCQIQGFIGESRLPMKITANIGASFPLNRFGTYRTNSGNRPKNAAVLSPNLLFQKQQDFMQLNYGVYTS